MKEIKKLVKSWKLKLLGYEKLKEVNTKMDTSYARLLEGKIITTKKHIEELTDIIKKYEPDYGD